MRTPKEAVYDEQIAPLMKRVIEICKEHGINMAAQFSLGFDPEAEETLFCTTALQPDPKDEVGYERIRDLRRAMFPRNVSCVAITVIGGKANG